MLLGQLERLCGYFGFDSNEEVCQMLKNELEFLEAEGFEVYLMSETFKAN